MSVVNCRTPIGTADLLDYWLGDCDSKREAEIEEHLFACPSCNDALQALVDLGDAVRALVRSGHAAAFISARFADTLKKTGLRINEYRLERNGSVNCTIAPHDDLVISYLKAPLNNVTRLDVVVGDDESNQSTRLQDVAFDSSQNEIVMLPSAQQLRQLGVATQRVALISVTNAGDRVLGEYVFNHTPYQSHEPRG